MFRTCEDKFVLCNFAVYKISCMVNNLILERPDEKSD